MSVLYTKSKYESLKYYYFSIFKKHLDYGKYKNINLHKLIKALDKSQSSNHHYLGDTIMDMFFDSSFDEVNDLKYSDRRKHVLIDIKLTKEKANTWPCIPGFHTDCTLDMDDPRPLDKLCIYNFSTKDIAHTEFELAGKTYEQLKHMGLNKTYNLECLKGENNTFHHYTRHQKHRCTWNTEDHERLFIRFTYTHIYKHRQDQLDKLINSLKS